MTQVIPPVIPPMDSTSTNIVADNINKLKELFPEAFTEGKVDFDALKEVLGEYVDGRDERYSFTWNGKSKARMIAQTPSTGTLRPCKEESVDWDSTQNLFIEGDNLEVLKLLQKSYHKKVKMIYIDPPYCNPPSKPQRLFVENSININSRSFLCVNQNSLRARLWQFSNKMRLEFQSLNYAVSMVLAQLRSTSGAQNMAAWTLRS